MKSNKVKTKALSLIMAMSLAAETLSGASLSVPVHAAETIGAVSEAASVSENNMTESDVSGVVSEDGFTAGSVIAEEEMLSSEAIASLMDKETTKLVYAEVDRVLLQLGTAKMSEYDKAATLFNWITDNVSYDYESYVKQQEMLCEEPIERPENLPESFTYSPHTAAGAIFDHNAVCQGYAELYKIMCQRAGLQAETITGCGHGWNVVGVDGGFYLCDVTFADAGDFGQDRGKTGPKYQHHCEGGVGYFLRGEKYFTDNYHEPNEEYKSEEFRKKFPVSWLDWGQKQELLADLSYPATVSYSLAFQALEELNKRIEKDGGNPVVMDQDWMDYAVIRAQEAVIYKHYDSRPDGTRTLIPSKQPNFVYAYGYGDYNKAVSYMYDRSKEWKLTCAGIGAVVVDEPITKNYSYRYDKTLSKKVMYYFVVGTPGDYKQAVQPEDVTGYSKVTICQWTFDRLEMLYDPTHTDLNDEHRSEEEYEGNILRVGDKSRFNLHSDTTDIPNNSFTWSSSNPDVLQVDQNGNFHAFKTGTTTVTLKIGQLKRTMDLSVWNKINPKKVKYDNWATPYLILDKKKKTVAYLGVGPGRVDGVSVPETVELDKKKYTVTAIADGACFGRTDIKSVTIPKTVTKIGMDAFRDCINVNKIKIKSTKLKQKNIGKNAFLNTGKDRKKLTVKYPKGKKTKYKKMLQRRGLSKNANWKKIG
ncbi:MAG: leucine-rich repeat protein [Lachnospiraceae bacterium]|nr:leucine-rich repeat protein [Lachnospiraceae bacterium]